MKRRAASLAAVSECDANFFILEDRAQLRKVQVADIWSTTGLLER
jgi:hypothetical protein